MIIITIIIVNNNDEIRQFHNNNEIPQNLQLAKELHKPIIRKFKKKKSLFRI